MIFQRAYDMIKKLHGDIGDYAFVDMIVDPYPEDDEWHEEDEDYIEFHFRNNIDNCLSTIIVPCTKSYAKGILWFSDYPCEESSWNEFGICDGECSKVNFDYYMQIGGLGYSEGE